jgi:hypothetical protein
MKDAAWNNFNLSFSDVLPNTKDSGLRLLISKRRPNFLMLKKQLRQGRYK